MKSRSLLGEGTFGKVYRYKDRKTNQFVVGKHCQKGDDEYHLLSQCHHENIVRMFGVYFFQKGPVMVLEYCSKGSLFDIWEENECYPFRQKELVEITRQVGNGLVYMHSKHLVHRDIKPHNILEGNNGRYLIADVGVGKNTSFDGPMTTCVGTNIFMAPEVMRNSKKKYTNRCDIYSLGATVLFLAMPKCMNYKKRMEEFIQLQDNPKRIGRVIDIQEPKLMEIFMKTLNHIASNRYTAKKLVEAIEKRDGWECKWCGFANSRLCFPKCQKCGNSVYGLSPIHEK